MTNRIGISDKSQRDLSQIAERMKTNCRDISNTLWRQYIYGNFKHIKEKRYL